MHDASAPYPSPEHHELAQKQLAMISSDAVDELISEGVRRGICHLTAEDDTLNGRTIRLANRDVVHFGSQSYLGLETDARLRDGAIDATCRFGTQFASSREFTSAPPYPELEGLLSAILGGQAVCTPTSAIGHLAAFPVVFDPDDLVVIDQMANDGLQVAARTIRHRQQVDTIRHNRPDLLEELVRASDVQGRRLWYLADGVYSTFGDRAPIEDLNVLMARYPGLRVYIDDANGMSWTGRHGSGSVQDRLVHRDRAVISVSLAQAFAAGGAATTSADSELIRRIRTCGARLYSCDPIAPPVLGAAIASARIHLTPEMSELQTDLRRRLHFRNSLLAGSELAVLSDETTPISFIGVGRTETAYEVVKRVLEAGFYVNSAVFPEVSMNRAGVRFAITRHHSNADIEGVIDAVKSGLIEELDRVGDTLEDVRQTFGLSNRGQAA